MDDSFKSEPEFRAYAARLRVGTFVICLAAIPIGLILHNPYVVGLAIAGLVVHGVRAFRYGSGYFAGRPVGRNA